jgi:hypothetical protein
MARDATDPSPPESLGGDDARDLYDELTDHLLYHPAIGRATMMGYPCMRLAGRFLASYDDKARCLVVKLPRERVTELIDNGRGDPFAPAGKVVSGCRSPLSTAACGSRCSQRPSTSRGKDWPSSSVGVENAALGTLFAGGLAFLAAENLSSPRHHVGRAGALHSSSEVAGGSASSPSTTSTSVEPVMSGAVKMLGYGLAVRATQPVSRPACRAPWVSQACAATRAIRPGGTRHVFAACR